MTWPTEKSGLPWPRPPAATWQKGFTLVELTIVLVIVALLIGGMLLPLSAQRDLQSTRETEIRLSEAKDALLGFAAANGRLPCPASASSNGVESYCEFPTGACGTAIIPPPLPIPAHGRCSHPYNGFLPSVTLGLSGVDSSGYLIDGWGLPSNRIRYAVYSTLNTAAGAIASVDNPFTLANGIRTATMTSIAGRSPLLSVCNAATGVQNGTFATAYCSTATKLTDSAVAVIFSLGKNAPTGGTGTDEAANLDNDPVFVSHTPAATGSVGGEFDDVVTWISPNILYSRMISAGRLP